MAEIVVGLGLDTDSVCAALLHDTVEDCADKTNLDAIRTRFGDDVAMLVDGLTKLVQIDVEDKEEANIENIRKMLLAMSKDIRVIFIKLCDRLHNMRTLGAKPEERRRAIALETMYIYAPLAHRLGISFIKQELENLSLSYLDPIGYEEVKNRIEERYGQSRDLLAEAKDSIAKKLTENGICFELTGRIKSIYSLYNKMYNHNKSFDQIYDFYALRIIVDTELECYTALGIIHEMFRSIPGRFKDYISNPKPNMYRSLHTSVMSSSGIPFEVQIRTHEMHQIAEFGIAAHWKYKSGEKADESIDEKLKWVSRLFEIEDDTRDPDEFLNAFKIDIFRDETFVFTPRGDVIVLPQGATTIDFAYAIHSAIGNKMVGAKINGMIVPIDREPQTGDIVEILTSSASKGPSRDWREIRAAPHRHCIRIIHFAEGRRPAHGAQAHQLRQPRRYVRRYRLWRPHRGEGRGPRDELTKATRRHDAEGAFELGKQQQQPAVNASGVIVEDIGSCMIKFSRCCTPVPGDDIIGFITKGYGVSVHRKDCPNAKNAMDPRSPADGSRLPGRRARRRRSQPRWRSTRSTATA